MSITKWEYEVIGNWGYGWDMVTTENTKADALVRLREYRQNDENAIFTIKRVKVEESK